MSRVFQGAKEASDDHGGASSPSQQYWDTNVPELTCKEESLDDDPPASELAMEPSPSQDIDIKGIMSRKGKGSAKGRQRASTVKCGKGKGDDKQAAKKDLEKIQFIGEKPEELEKNNNQEQAKTDVEREAESSDDEDGDEDGDEEDDDEDLGYHD